MPLRRDDGGALQTLEATLIALILVGSVSFVITFNLPTSPTEPAHQRLQGSVEDAMNVLYETPTYAPGFGDNALSRAVAHCMVGDCDELTGRVKSMLPPGARFNVWLSNGYMDYPVYVPELPRGEAVAVARPLEPKWSFVFLGLDANYANPETTGPLTVYALPIEKSNVATEGGIPLGVVVHGKRADGSGNATFTAYATTVKPTASNQARTQAITLAFLDGDPAMETTAPAAYYDVSATTADAAGRPTLDDAAFFVRVANAPGAATLPAGSTLRIDLPRGWSASASAAANPDWSGIRLATDHNASYLSSHLLATLDDPLPGGAERHFTFHGTMHEGKRDHYLFTATFGEVTHARAELAVRGNRLPTPSLVDYPFVAFTAPKPMAAESRSTLAIALSAPIVDTTADVPEIGVMVERVEIVMPSGHRLFTNTTEVVAGKVAGGWWNMTTDGRLVWTCDQPEGCRHDRESPFELVLTVEGDPSTETPTAVRPAHVVPVRFDAFTGKLTHYVNHGFLAGEFWPDGLDDSTAPTPETRPGYASAPGRHVLDTSTVLRVVPLRGYENYTTEGVPSYKESAAGTSFHPDVREVPLGGRVVMEAEATSLIFKISDLGRTSQAAMRLYPPFAVDKKWPIWANESLDTSILSSDVTAMIARDVNNDGFDDVIVGTSSGRVLAIDGRTGYRLPSYAYLVPRTGDVPAAVTHLQRATFDGLDVMVVGTDKNGAYVHGLDFSFQERYRWTKPGAYAVVALDAGADIDRDGILDVQVALDNSKAYVLSGKLQPNGYFAAIPPTAHAGTHFYQAPSNDGDGLAGLKVMGPWRQPGFAAGMSSIPSTSSAVSYDIDRLNAPQFRLNAQIALPRAGMQGVNQNGSVVWTMYGLPASHLAAQDYNADGVTDVAVGSPAGYVVVANGSQAVQPLYSLIFPGVDRIGDSHAVDQDSVAFLTELGHFGHTDDAFITVGCACDPVTGQSVPLAGAEAVSVRTNGGAREFWVVGAANAAWRGTVDPTTGVVVFTPVVWNVGADQVKRHAPNFPYLPLPADMAANLHTMNDVHFKGDAAGTAFIVGSRCATPSDCKESLVMKRVSSGTWYILTKDNSSLVAYPSGPVRDTLRKVDFTTDALGWILGDERTVLRTFDGGSTWRGIRPPADLHKRYSFSDVSCVANATAAGGHTCWFVSVDSATLPTSAYVHQLENAGSPLNPEWRNVSKAMPAAAVPRSVGFVDATTGYLGATNQVLVTYNGGRNWTKLPMNYVESDTLTMQVFGDGHGWLLGGKPTGARVFALRDHRTTSIAESAPIDAGGTISKIKLAVDASNIANGSSTGGTWVQYYVSNSPTGNDWVQVKPGLVPGTWQDVVFPTGGTSFRWRAELHVSHDVTFFSPQIRKMTFTVEHQGGGSAVREQTFASSAAKGARTTADWNTTLGVLRAPLVRELWAQNVNGEVTDMALGDVDGDGTKEIVVGTAGVFAINDPANALYAGLDPSRWVRDDRRVYVLDPARGLAPRWVSDPLPQNVTSVLITKLTDDGVLDVVASTWGKDAQGELVGRLWAFDVTPMGGRLLWTRDIEQRVIELVAGQDPAAPTRPMPVAATVGTSTTTPGYAYAHRWSDGEFLWRGIPDERGRFSVPLDLPMLLPLGPYVMEFEVSWVEDVTKIVGGVPVTTSVVQAARFYDYFTVVPPSGNMPVSPIYTVKIVAWMGEWDYGREAPPGTPGGSAGPQGPDAPGIRYRGCIALCWLTDEEQGWNIERLEGGAS